MMNQQLKLTARGQAVCLLMTELGLTLEAACSQVENELETLRRRVDRILHECSWEDVPGAMRNALESVSPGVAEAYLDESTHEHGATAQHASVWHQSSFVH